MRMSLWSGRLVILAAAFFFVGWGLALLSGHGGNSIGGSEAVWEIGGLMIYAALPTFVVAAVVAVVVGADPEGLSRSGGGGPPD
jgi:hypothetical protein